MFKDCTSLLKIFQHDYKNKVPNIDINIYSEEENLFDFIDNNDNDSSNNSLFESIDDFYFYNYSTISTNKKMDSNFSTFKNTFYCWNKVLSNFSSIISVPISSICKKKGLIDISELFYNCSSLLSLP